jgi:6,7-dimethyl-8-ribityllumazine synthase
MKISIESKKPIGNGIITCLNMKQAVVRKKKGAEAANAILSVLSQK